MRLALEEARAAAAGGDVPVGAVIVRVAGPDEEQVRVQVMRTVAHEVAHHFGISDDRLREIDAY